MPSRSPSQKPMAPTLPPTTFSAHAPTSIPSKENHPTWKPTIAPIHNPTPRPSLYPTLSPLIVITAETAIVLDMISVLGWETTEKANARAVSSALTSTLSGEILSNESAITDICALAPNNEPKVIERRSQQRSKKNFRLQKNNVQRQQPILFSGISDIFHRRLDYENILLLISMVVNIDENEADVATPGAALSSLKRNMISIVNDGSLGVAIEQYAKKYKAATLANATVDSDASLFAIDTYTNITEVQVTHRYPTPLPSLTVEPTVQPSESPLIDIDDTDFSNLDDNTKAGWSNPNPWLLFVIILEILISILLCACCVRISSNSNRNRDPLALNALAAQQRRGIIDGIIDPASFGIHTARLREQYAEAVRALPQMKFTLQQRLVKEVMREKKSLQNIDTSEGALIEHSKEDVERRSLTEQIDSNRSGREEEKLSLPNETDIYVEDTCSICLMKFTEEEEETEEGLVKMLNCGQ